MKESHLKNHSLIPPCQDACPVKTRARDYVRAVAMGYLKEAYEIITENNPFPSVCGRVCMHPCEQACRRNETDRPISIAGLKRYAADFVNENNLYIDSGRIAQSRKKVAIVGAGPSGLSAAVKLVEAGHNVEVYEKDKKAGGMLRYGIPKYRLDDAALDEDIKRIEAKGVKIFTETKVDSEKEIERFRKEFDATLISVGLNRSIPLNIEGSDNNSVLLAIPFLRAVNRGHRTKLGKRVVIVGGGNTAFDCARTARRKGARVTIIYRRTIKEMPARDTEIKETIEEGVKIRYLTQPLKVLSNKSGKIKEIECAKTKLGKPDESGRRRIERLPKNISKKNRFKIKADTMIVAIGQQADLSFLSEPFIDKIGNVVYDKDTLAVADDGVFTSGETATGPGSAIQAIAHGNKVATIINKFLAREKIGSFKDNEQIIGELPKEVAERIVEKKRQETWQLEPKKRLRNFNEFDKGFSKRTATKEALRCFDCGSGAYVDADKCIACLTCVRVCPFTVAKMDAETNIAYMPVEGCQSCGACASECPANAIDVLDYPLEEQLNDVRLAFKKDMPDIIAFICQTGKDLQYPKSKLIRVKCPIRLHESTYLKAFELGARKVFITCHRSESCRYISGLEYTRRKVGYIKQILDNMGIGHSNIEVFIKNDKKSILAFIGKPIKAGSELGVKG